jgi:WD40 repeat protein
MGHSLDYDSAIPKGSFQSRFSITHVNVTADSHHVVAAGSDGSIKVWELRFGELVRTLVGSDTEAVAVDTTPDDRLVIAGGRDGTLGVWNLEDREGLRLGPNLPGFMEIVDASITADGRMAAFGWTTLENPAAYGQVDVCDVAAGTSIRRVAFREGVQFARIAADGRRVIVVGLGDRHLSILDVAGGSIVALPQEHRARIMGVAVSADGRQAISSDVDGYLVAWDVERGRKLWNVRAHREGTRAVAIAANGRFAASAGLAPVAMATEASTDGVVSVWDMASGKEVQKLKGHVGWISCVAITADGRGIVSGGADRALHVWKASQSGKVDHHLLAGHDGAIEELAITADGLRAMSVGRPPGNTMVVWDLATLSDIRTFNPPGLFGGVLGFAAAGDGRIALTRGSLGWRAYLWDFSRAKLYEQLEARGGHAVEALARQRADATAFADVGEWYAFQGLDDWAIRMLERARTRGSIAPLTLGRCYWRVGRFRDAAGEFDKALANARDDQERFHLTLCIEALTRATTRPSTRSDSTDE